MIARRSSPRRSSSACLLVGARDLAGAQVLDRVRELLGARAACSSCAAFELLALGAHASPARRVHLAAGAARSRRASPRRSRCRPARCAIACRSSTTRRLRALAARRRARRGALLPPRAARPAIASRRPRATATSARDGVALARRGARSAPRSRRSSRVGLLLAPPERLDAGPCARAIAASSARTSFSAREARACAPARGAPRPRALRGARASSSASRAARLARACVGSRA